MSDINFCYTKEQLTHLGEVVTGKVDGSPTGADIDISTLPYTGQVRKTLTGLEKEILSSASTTTFIAPAITYGFGELVPRDEVDVPNNKYAQNQSIEYAEPGGAPIAYVLRSESSLPYDLTQPFNVDDFFPVSIARKSYNYEPEGWSKYQKIFPVTDKVTGDPLSFIGVNVIYNGKELKSQGDDISVYDYTVSSNVITLINIDVDPAKDSLWFKLYQEEPIGPSSASSSPSPSSGLQAFSLRDEPANLENGGVLTQSIVNQIADKYHVTMDGLQGIIFDKDLDWSNTSLRYFDFAGGASAVSLGSQVVWCSESESRDVTIDFSQASYYNGDCKLGVIASDVQLNSNSISLVDASEFVAGDRAASSFDNFNMSNSPSFGTVNLITGVSGNNISLQNQVLTDVSDSIIPAGAYVTTADFTRNGNVYYGSGKFKLIGSSEDNFNRWSGYMALCGNTLKTGSFECFNVNLSNSILDGFLLYCGDTKFDSTYWYDSIEPGKQATVYDCAPGATHRFYRNTWNRSNADYEMLWFPRDGISAVNAGNLILHDNKFNELGYFWDATRGITESGITGYGRLSSVYCRKSLNFAIPFNSVGVSGSSISASDSSFNYARAMWGTSNNAKSQFSSSQMYFENCRFYCNPVWRDVTGETSLDYIKWEATFINCFIEPTMATLNYGVRSSLYNSEVVVTEENRDANAGRIRAPHCKFYSGKVEGRLNFTGEYWRAEHVWIPYKPGETNDIVLISGLSSDQANQFILEARDSYPDGFLNINDWIAFDGDTTRPGTPPVLLKIENSNTYIQYGGQFSDGQYIAKLRSDNAGSAPQYITGQWGNKLPDNSPVISESDGVTRTIARTTRLVTTSGNGGSGFPSDITWADDQYSACSAYNSLTGNTVFFTREDAEDAGINFDIPAGGLIQFIAFGSASAHHNIVSLLSSVNFYELESSDRGRVIAAKVDAQEFRLRPDVAEGFTCEVIPPPGTGFSITVAPDANCFLFAKSGLSRDGATALVVNAGVKLVKTNLEFSGKPAWFYELIQG